MSCVRHMIRLGEPGSTSKPKDRAFDRRRGASPLFSQIFLIGNIMFVFTAEERYDKKCIRVVPSSLGGFVINTYIKDSVDSIRTVHKPDEKILEYLRSLRGEYVVPEHVLDEIWTFLQGFQLELGL